MTKVRAQYHLRQTETGIDAWSVERLIELSRNLPIRMINPQSFSELHENHWYFHDGDLVPTPHSVMEHMKLISDAEFAYPVILDQAGRVMDGMHRICKAILNEVSEIAAVQFAIDPEPDFVNCDLKELSYDA